MTYNYNISTANAAATGGIAAIGIGLMIFMIVLCLAVSIFSIIVTWKMFQKAGEEGWKSIIPVYNKIILFKIIGYKWYYILFFALGFVPVVGRIALVLFGAHYNIKLAKSYGQSIGFGIGLFLVKPVFGAIIAFSKDINYIGPTVNGDIDFNDLF